MTNQVAVIVGSLRKNSLNRKVAHALVSLAPKTVDYTFIEINELPLYNQDLEDALLIPKAWGDFRKEMNSCEGVLFVTPEYNRSIPAPLKNAIDVGSRPYGQSVWDNKAAAIVSVSPGAIGGFGSSQHLRQSLSCLNVALLPSPEAYIGFADKLFNEQGELINEGTAKFFRSFMEQFSSWIDKHTYSK